MAETPRRVLSEARVKELIRKEVQRRLRAAFASNLGEVLSVSDPITILNEGSENASVGLLFDEDTLELTAQGELALKQLIQNLDDLDDVNIPTPNANEVPTWDADAQEWIAKEITVIDFDEADFGIFILWSFTPSGAIDGTNDTFFLPAQPEGSNILIAKNGLVQSPGSDYTHTAGETEFKFVAGNLPQVGDSLVGMMEQPPNPADLVFNEVPAGDVDGVNDTFTVSEDVNEGRILVTKNGLVQSIGNDVTFNSSTNQITFVAGNIPQTGDRPMVFYEKVPEEE